jgi:hypothetical protein
MNPETEHQIQVNDWIYAQITITIREVAVGTYRLGDNSGSLALCKMGDEQRNANAVAMYEEESVNGTQMDVKRKICDISTWKKRFISRRILQQH